MEVKEIKRREKLQIKGLKTELLNYQNETVLRMLEHDNYGIFLEQGTGKTMIAISRILTQSKKNGLKKVAIVCPKSNIDLTWGDEFLKHSNITPYLFKSGSPEKLGKQWTEAASKKVHVMSYEHVYGLRGKWNYFDYNMVILDESTRIKNIATQTFKSVDMAFRSTKYRYIMSGLPNPEAVTELFPQFLFMDRGKTFGTDSWDFKYRYMQQLDEYHWIQRQDTADELDEKAGSASIRILKKDWLDVPDRHYFVDEVPASKKQRRMYRKLEDDFVLELNSGSYELSWIFQQINMMRQLTSGFVYTREPKKYGEKKGKRITTVFKNNPKLEALMNIIEEATSPVIVICKFTAEIDIIKNRLANDGYTFDIITGKVTGDDRARVVRRFQKGKYDVLIAEITTVMYGIELDRSDTMVFFSPDWSHMKRAQAEERLSRMNSTKEPKYIDLVMKNTMDEVILNALDNKTTLKTAVLRRFKQ